MPAPAMVLYSERGLVFALTQWLVADVEHVRRFLLRVEWGLLVSATGADRPPLVQWFEGASPAQMAAARVSVIVEPCFGQRGFGSPDLVLVVEVEPGVAHAVFVEAKAGPYHESACRWIDPMEVCQVGANSRLNLQLALRYRLAAALTGHDKAPLPALVEPPEVFDWFRANLADKGAAKKGGPPARRHCKQRVVLRDLVFGLLRGVTPERCSYLAITDETGIGEDGQSPLHELGFAERLAKCQRPLACGTDRAEHFLPPPIGHVVPVSGPAPFAGDLYRRVTGWVGWSMLADPKVFADPSGTLAPGLRAVVDGLRPAVIASSAGHLTTFMKERWHAESGAWEPARAQTIEGLLGPWSSEGSWSRGGIVVVKVVRLLGDRLAVGVSERAKVAFDQALMSGAFAANPPSSAGKRPFAWTVVRWSEVGLPGGPWPDVEARVTSALST